MELNDFGELTHSLILKMKIPVKDKSTLNFMWLHTDHNFITALVP